MPPLPHGMPQPGARCNPCAKMPRPAAKGKNGAENRPLFATTPAKRVALGRKSSGGTFEQPARSQSDGGSAFCRQGPAWQFYVNSSEKKARQSVRIAGLLNASGAKIVNSKPMLSCVTAPKTRGRGACSCTGMRNNITGGEAVAQGAFPPGAKAHTTARCPPAV